MESDDSRHVDHLHEHINQNQKLSDFGVAVHLTIEEVNDRIDHHDVWVVERYLITERLDVAILHEILSESSADDEVIKSHLPDIIVR